MDYLNTHIKHREAFRPFAPTCLIEESPRWFELTDSRLGSPFMMRACRVRSELMDLIPAVVHVDGSARIQTLTKHDNEEFYNLVNRFYEKTGVPMVLNTSFNIAGEPLVETPTDALWCLLATGLDECVIEGCVVVKKNSFHSLLDLYPQLASGQLKVVTTLEDVTSGRSSTQHDYLTTMCRTPWGDFERFFPWSTVRILERIDGSTNGRTIFADVSDDGSLLTEVELTRVLLELAHARLISFAEAPFQEKKEVASNELSISGRRN